MERQQMRVTLVALIAILTLLSGCGDTTNNYYSGGGENSNGGNSGTARDYCDEHLQLCPVPSEFESRFISTCNEHCTLEQIDTHQDEACIAIVCQVEDGCCTETCPNGALWDCMLSHGWTNPTKGNFDW